MSKELFGLLKTCKIGTMAVANPGFGTGFISVVSKCISFQFGFMSLGSLTVLRLLCVG